MRRISRAPELAALLLLAACGQPAEEAAPAPVSVEAPPPAVLAWTASENAIVLQEGGVDVLSIACVGEGLLVHGERFTPVGSEERMSIGAGNTVVTLVATPAEDHVKGEGPIDPDFIRAVAEGRKIAVNYGYQNMGPFDAPPADLAASFAAGCGG